MRHRVPVRGKGSDHGERTDDIDRLQPGMTGLGRMPDTYREADLRLGDVLLYRGTSLNARLIQLFDRSEVSHSALWLGAGTVAEVLNDSVGLQMRTLRAGFASSEWAEVRRHPAAGNAAPIVGRARHYLGRGAHYAYDQVVLLALLVVARRLPAAPGLARLVRSVLDAAAERVLLLTAHGRQPMICSEFVFRCFREAAGAGANEYPILIRAGWADDEGLEGRDPDRARGVEPGSLLDRLRKGEIAEQGVLESRAAALATPEGVALEALATAYLSQVEAGLESGEDVAASPDTGPALERFAAALRSAAGDGLEARAEPRAVLESAVADLVTPGDLRRTESFVRLGGLIPPDG